MRPERVIPSKSSETGKVAISALENTIMFDCESGQMCIGNKIATGAPISKYSLKYRPVGVRGLNNANTWLLQPALHAFNCLLDCKGSLLQSCICADANKGGEDRP